MVKRNVDVTTGFIHSRYQNSLERELDFLKLNVKFPLLISDNTANYEVWNACFPEANRSIWKTPNNRSETNCCNGLPCTAIIG